MKIILISHSEQLGMSAKKYLKQMIPDLDESIVEVASGTFDSRVGTDFQKILDVVERNPDCEEFLLICDLGSAVLSAQSAQAMCDKNLHISNGSFLEGAFAAAISIKSGLDFKSVIASSEEKITKI